MLPSLARTATRATAQTLRAAPPPAARAAARTFASSACRCFSPTRTRASDPLPWFVDPATAPTASPASPSLLSTSPQPTPPPSHLSAPLHPLHAHLSASPFFDKDALTYIHARERDPEGSWCDWVVIATLREGRERGIRGAAEGVRTFLAKTPIDLADPSPSSSSSTTPLFSPSASSPLVTGLPPSASKHARSRSRGPPPTRADQATGWAMVDAGRVVVHVMTREAREGYGRGVEEVWEASGAEEGAVRRLREQEEEEERARELEENMEAMRREIEEEAVREQAAKAPA
ncbi:hypothetical protein JCM6882_008927 [Rhodosporidiobolus microsporus]